MDGELDVEAVSGREAGTGNDFNRERAKIRYAVAELNILWRKIDGRGRYWLIRGSMVS